MSGEEARAPRPPRPQTAPRLSNPSLSGEEAPDFASVEAAIARLEGRDPTLAADVALARRDGERRREELKAVVDDAQRRVEQQERRKRILIPIAAAGGIIAVGLGVALFVNHAAAEDADAALEAAAEQAAKPFRALDFRDRSFEVDLPVTLRSEPGTCYLALGAARTGTPVVAIQRGVEKAEGPASAAWCGCNDAEVTISVKGEGRTAAKILLTSAGGLGGSDFLGRLQPRPGTFLPEVDDRACAERAIDELVADGPAPAPTPPDALGKRLIDMGVRLLGTTEAASFVKLPDTENTCFIVRSEGPTDALSLRLPGGTRPLEGHQGILAACQAAPLKGSVWLEGQGKLWLFAAPLMKVGGALGLSEALERGGLDDVPIFHGQADFAAEARGILLASGATTAHLVEGTTSLLGSPDPPFLFAFASADKSAASNVALDRGVVACDPPLPSSPTSALCLGPAAAFEGVKAARANRPEWLRVGTNPAAYGEVLQLLSFSRRLSLAGFAPTSTAGVTPTPTGADVVGRAGESAVVAIAVASKPPYLRPLTDGPPWTLGGDPRITPLAPGARVSLTATPPYTALEERGAILLFRR